MEATVAPPATHTYRVAFIDPQTHQAVECTFAGDDVQDVMHRALYYAQGLMDEGVYASVLPD